MLAVIFSIVLIFNAFNNPILVISFHIIKTPAVTERLHLNLFEVNLLLRPQYFSIFI